MKINTIFGDDNCPVVAYYDIENVRHYIYVARRDAIGTSIVRQDECIIVDDDSRYFIRVTTNLDQDMYVDEIANQGDKLNDMIECQEEAMAGFWKAVDERDGMNS